ncbi:hypothetical protein ACRC6Q_16610 [Planococcus sp. SE5232]|uniref:hypothetical protein n=1 Tax=unclassified Planococcus (in: firmicutes) TaxID=2662419 RepID=UPI003D6B73D6
MVVQRIIVTAKNAAELAMRIEDNELRDYKVINVIKTKHNEHKHYTYQPNIRGTKKRYASSDQSEKHSVVMERDYKPAMKIN